MNPEREQNHSVITIPIKIGAILVGNKDRFVFKRKQLFNLLKVLISLGLIVFVFLSVDLHTLAKTLLNVDPGFLSLALACTIGGVILRA